MTMRRPSNRDDWIAAASCRGIELDVFFPVGLGRAAGWDESRAKAICRGCPVLDTCREWALELRPEFGIFGGLTPDERRATLAARRRGSTTPDGERSSARRDV